MVNFESVVNNIAGRIRKAYCTTMRRLTASKTFNPSKKFDKYFIAAAKMCIANRVNPEEFIDVQFHALKPYPYITQLHTESAIQRFFKRRKSYAVDVAIPVLIQMSALEKLMAAGHTPVEIFTDTMQEFDALFKYVVASRYGLHKLADVYFQKAFEQYITSNYYDGIYIDLIPDKLKLAAERMRR